MTLAKGGRAALSYDATTTALSVAYAFRPETVMKEGIRVLHSDARTAAPDVPDSYHFRPPFGWMNDPNGFGRFGGNVHLFYQHYPHEPRWNTMHWGHAVSKDFVRWTHLPMFLFPAAHLSEKDDGRGGAFSGSAIPGTGPDGEEIRVFTPSMCVTGNRKSKSSFPPSAATASSPARRKPSCRCARKA